jgi:hypothetical protein
LHCENEICCLEGETCCDGDEDCTSGIACFVAVFYCYGLCYEFGENDAMCAEGYHCEDLLGCQADLVGGADCDEASDCIAGECITGHCCEHAGLCCEDDADCPEMFFGCDNGGPGYTMTCAFGDFAVPDPGQDTDQCYNSLDSEVACSSFDTDAAYYGQDGHYNLNPHDYDTDTDGEVADLVTGLVWEQAVAAGPVDHAAAVSACSGDWRLPKRYELQTILHYGIAETATWYIDTDGFYVPGSGSGDFWTATDVAGTAGAQAWIVGFKNGTVFRGVKSDADAWVRCVKP